MKRHPNDSSDVFGIGSFLPSPKADPAPAPAEQVILEFSGRGISDSMPYSSESGVNRM